MAEGDPIVTLATIFAEQREQSLRLERIEAKLDGAASTVTDHETRIRSTEKWSYAIPPAILGSLTALAATLLLK